MRYICCAVKTTLSTLELLPNPHLVPDDLRYLQRHGSVTENAAATQAPQHEAKSWYGEGRRSRVQKAGDRVSDDIPALRRSKIRGRDMVFSLLEAARVEEEEMVSNYGEYGRY